MAWTEVFSDQPPTDNELIKTLFVDREHELQDVLDTYGSPGADHGKVMVIHGDRRSGKSHLARRALVALQEMKEPMILVQVNANKEQKADSLLRRVYHDLAGKLLAMKPAEMESQEHRDVLVFAKTHASRMQKLLLSSVREVTVEHARETADRIERRAGARAGTEVKGKVLAFIGAHVRGEIQQERAAEQAEALRDGVSYTLAPPSPDGLVHEIAFLASSLVYLQSSKKRVLLFVDDMDLLSYGPAAPQEELDMAGHLATLAAEEAIHVVATVRSDLYAKRESHFVELCEPLGPMTEADLREIYRRRVQAYAGGKEFFTADALGLLAAGAGGLVGDFLGFGYRAYRSVRHESETASGQNVRQYFAGRWDYVARQIPARAAQQIQQRISQGIVEVAGADLRQEGFEPATSSLFSEGVIKPVPYQADQYRISPIFVEVIGKGRTNEAPTNAAG